MAIQPEVEIPQQDRSTAKPPIKRTPPERKRKKGLKKLWDKNKTAILFLSPWFLGFTVLGLVPMVVSLYLSFTEYNMFTAPDWIGLANYSNMFTEDARFLKSIEVTFIYVFLGVPLQLLAAFLFAIFLNKGVTGLSTFRAIYYIPSLLGPSVAIAILWLQLFGTNGVFNEFLGAFNIAGRSWVTNPDTAIYTLIALLVWQFGSPMVIFLAGLRQIPKELHESAAIDGANAFRQFISITLPLLTPIIFFNLVMQVISAFQAFTPAFIIGGGQGGPLDSTLFYTLYLYIKAFNQFQMGYAAALAWVLFLIIASLTALFFLTSKKWVHYES